jgi:integrase
MWGNCGDERIVKSSKSLSALFVKAATQPGSYVDGQGLMLVIKPAGSKSWILRTTHNGRRRDFGLGGYPSVSLGEAREIAKRYRDEIRAGRDPLVFKRRRPERQTFKEAAEATMEALAEKLDKRTIGYMRARLESYAYPALGRLELGSIDADVLADVLRPIWTRKPSLALRVRQYVIRVLRFAHPDGHLLEGALAKKVSDKLPRRPAGEHYAALPAANVPDLMRRLAEKAGMGALALRLLILTASRSGEVRGASWTEMDLDAAVWEIPATRMKMRRSHRIPLSSEALAVLSKADELKRTGCDLVFPSKSGKALSDMTLTKVLRDMSVPAKVHGFRSTFADWRAEMTDFPEEIAEAALAHEVPNEVTRAYRRTDFFDRRRDLMGQWADFCNGKRVS